MRSDERASAMALPNPRTAARPEPFRLRARGSLVKVAVIVGSAALVGILVVLVFIWSGVDSPFKDEPRAHKRVPCNPAGFNAGAWCREDPNGPVIPPKRYGF
jgi:hypothetical protein